MAAVLTLSACDTYGTDPVVTPPPGSAVDTLTTIHVPARATYLRTHDDPDARDAVPVDLRALGVEPGQRIAFYTVGYAILDPRFPSDTRSRSVGGVFSRSITLGPSDTHHRVVDALAAGAPFVTMPTALGDHPTDIAEDFLAAATSVVVPDGARALFLSVADVYYSDNEDLGDGIRVTLLRVR